MKAIYARRYARAVFEIALGGKQLDQWQSDLRQISVLLKNSELITLLESPKIRFEDKAKVLAQELDDINPSALNLVYSLVAKNRLGIIGDIVEEYQRLLDSHQGVDRAEVISAVLLDKEDELRLTEHLEAVTGKKIILKSEVDHDLKGGFIVRVGGKVLDGSIRSKLVALKRELIGEQRS